MLPSVTSYKGDITGFFNYATLDEVDQFLAKYIKAGCFVKNRQTGEDKLPTGPTFHNQLAFLKRIVNQYYLPGDREINFDKLKAYTRQRKLMLTQIEINGQPLSKPTNGITLRDRKMFCKRNCQKQTKKIVLNTDIFAHTLLCYYWSNLCDSSYFIITQDS